MTHNDIRHKLSEYLDNAVSDSEKAETDAHLKTCRICSDALEELRKTIDQVKQIEEIESPAWMTGKIMAQVRAEAEQKKSLFQRFFYPPAIKVPIQTVAVLFLAVTAYYLYLNITPAAKYAEIPMRAVEKQAAPEPAMIAKEEKVMQAPAPQPKKIEQEPGYKSLDMKYQYEKPAPAAPVPASAAAGAAPAAPEANVMRSKAADALQEKAEQPAGFAKMKKARSSAPQSAAKSAPGETYKISLSVKDLAGTEKEIEHIISYLKGTVVRKETLADSRFLVVAVNATMIGQLRDQLAKLGVFKEKDRAVVPQEGMLQVEITVTSASLLERH